MGLLDKLLGRDPDRNHRQGQPYGDPQATQYGGREGAQPAGPHEGSGEDARAVERYQYLLRTAPPERIEQAHAEAFSRLTPQQRQQVLAQLSQDAPEPDRPRDDSPQALARSATRMEVQRPGSLSQAFGGGRGMGSGPGVGTILLGTVAGAFIGTAIAQSMFDDPGMGAEQAGEGAEGGAGAGGDPGAEAGGGFDFGGGDFGGGDFGGF